MSKFAAVLLCLVAFGAVAETATLQDALFRIQYNPADQAIAEKSLAILNAALHEFPPELAPGAEPIHVILASSFNEFRQLAGAYGKAQVVGIAQGDRGIIVVKAPYLLPPDSEYASVLRHELAHVLMARNTNPDNVPRWFDEGVAMIVSRELRWSTTFSLARMYVSGDVIPYYQMNFAFAPMGDEVAFGDAYAQALSVTQYLNKRVGDKAFWRLVHELKYREFDEALKTQTGLTPGALYDGWTSTLWKFAVIGALVSGFGLFQLMAVLLLIAYWIKHRRGQQIVQEWAEEDGDHGEPVSDEVEYDSPWTPIEEEDDDEEDRW